MVAVSLFLCVCVSLINSHPLTHSILSTLSTLSTLSLSLSLSRHTINLLTLISSAHSHAACCSLTHTSRHPVLIHPSNPSSSSLSSSTCSGCTTGSTQLNSAQLWQNEELINFALNYQSCLDWEPRHTEYPSRRRDVVPLDISSWGNTRTPAIGLLVRFLHVAPCRIDVQDYTCTLTTLR